MMLGIMIYDQWWWLALPGLLLGIYAQLKLSSTYSHYLQVRAETGVSGAEAAREILDRAGLREMPVNEVRGHLTDHYDPMRKALFLSSENYHGRSLAAVGVAAHEAGHALQHQASYAFLNLRMLLVPVTQFASMAAYGIFILSILFSYAKLATLAVVVFGVIALFQLITLPVEFDASRRAKEQLLKLGLVRTEEGAGISRVLNAAAMTYVAAMVSTLLEVLHWMMIARSNDRN